MAPTYIERDNDIIYRPPYLQAGTTLTMWPVQGEMKNLQDIIDKHLNVPLKDSGWTYEPVTSKVLLVLADIQRVTSLEPSQNKLGFVPETDICTWILCAARKHGVLDHIAFYVPYIWVTNADTMATGREVYGYPKAFGWAETLGKPSMSRITADGFVLPEFGPNQEVSRQRLFTLERPEAAQLTAADKISGAREVWKFLIELLGDLERDVHALLEKLLDLLPRPYLPMVFLKQFRELTSSTEAAYQAVVEAHATVQSFEGLWPLVDWQLDMKSYESVKMPSTLGLVPQQLLRLGACVKFSFSMDLGTVIWRTTP